MKVGTKLKDLLGNTLVIVDIKKYCTGIKIYELKYINDENSVDKRSVGSVICVGSQIEAYKKYSHKVYRGFDHPLVALCK